MPKDLSLSIDEWRDLFVYARQICAKHTKDKGWSGKRARRVVALIDKHYADCDATRERRSA